MRILSVFEMDEQEIRDLILKEINAKGYLVCSSTEFLTDRDRVLAVQVFVQEMTPEQRREAGLR